MKYVIKDMIGYVGESINDYWHKVAKTIEDARKFDSKEEAEQYKTLFTKKAQKFMTIVEVE